MNATGCRASPRDVAHAAEWYDPRLALAQGGSFKGTTLVHTHCLSNVDLGTILRCCAWLLGGSLVVSIAVSDVHLEGCSNATTFGLLHWITHVPSWRSESI